LMLIGWMSGSGQTNTIRINNFTGINSGCQAEMQTIANELKTILVANGEPVNLFLTKVYPPAVYMKAQDGVNAMEKVAIESVEALDTNYIHFIAKVKANSEIVELSLKWKLSDSNVGNLCYSKLNFLREHIQKSIDSQISKNSSISNLDCVVKTALSEIKLRKISDCSMNALERKAWFEANEFEFHELKGMKLDYGDGALRPKDNKKTTRSTCAYADYTQGDLKYILSNGGKMQIHALLSEVDIPFERRLIITDKYISESICDSIKIHEMENPSCDVVIWLHFGDTFQGGKDEVGVRIARKNAPGTADSYTYEQLEAQYKLKDTGIFGGFLNIDFRLKNYKSEIIDMINHNEYSDYIPRAAITSAEYYAGYVSGFVDGAIESVDLIYLIAQAAYQSQSSLDPNSMAWWSDLFINANKKRNLYEAYKDKWNETFDNWVKLKDNVIVMYNSLKNDVIRKEMWRNFSIVFVNAISGAGTKLNKWGKDILFISESYDSGYAHGKIAFDLIPVGWLFTVGKGAIGAAKVSKNIVSEIAESVGKSMDGPTARTVLRRSTIDLTELITRIGNRQNLKFWFDADMPALVKVELGKHMDDVDFFNKLETDLANPKWTKDIKDLITAKPTDLTDKYKLLADDAGRAWEVAGSDPSWGAWAQRTFFKDVCAKARVFEDGIAYQTFLQIPGLNAASIVKQVTLEVNGIKVRFDFIAKDANGKFIFGEAKFSTKNKNWTTDWLGAATESQKDVFPLFNNNGSGVNSIFVRATDQTKIGELFNKLNLSPNDPIILSEISSFKLFGSAADAQIVSQTISLFP